LVQLPSKNPRERRYVEKGPNVSTGDDKWKTGGDGQQDIRVSNLTLVVGGGGGNKILQQRHIINKDKKRPLRWRVP